MRGLLLYPEFPDSAFWSYRHVMRMVGAKSAFPPLGLMTFAAAMPAHWSFELLDLNVEHPSGAELRDRFAAVDAVFVSAMSVQKRSLVTLLSGPARGVDTPWVLGGPYPSSYRDHILDPATESDEMLHRGLDVLVWGECDQWIDAIDALLHGERSRHSDTAPALLIPDAISAQAPGSRKALNDRSIFRELETTHVPRWDLIRPSDYRAMMMQTTVGCRFRCDFCDIIQFNGGFTRPKTLESVRAELVALYELGYRGGIFTVDDNFIGNPAAIASILRVMIDFQRAHDYPFSFYTQASLDLGSPKLAHLLPLMKQAGFSEVFLGIENPDPAALQGMNKKQNTKVDIAATVATIQRSGIEVMAGFIFGSDEDTIDTADAIATFATQTAIPTAMTGMLTPIPHTPLRERLRLEGRLHEAEFSGNNTDDAVQFTPKRMSVAEMQRGYYQILRRLFAPRAMFERSCLLLERLEPHIFHGDNVRSGELRPALRSLWLQGVLSGARMAYLRLIMTGWRRDVAEARVARAERQVLAGLQRYAPASSEVVQASAAGAAPLETHLDRARDAMIRADPERGLDEIDAWVKVVSEHIVHGTVNRDEVAAIYEWSDEFSKRRERLHRFPGAYLVKAFNLAIKGLHYATVMHGLAHAGAFRERAEGAAPGVGRSTVPSRAPVS
jgi:radical SAM superfamily enzyme YgiQ (UPF0313 family)